MDRLWYGGGSLRSVRWAASAGLNLLAGNIVSGEGTDDFVTAQLAHIREYRAIIGRPSRIAVGRVIVPLDSADRATRQRYLAYAETRRERTRMPHGERRTLSAPDVIGTSDEIVDRLRADAAVQEVDELRLELPYEFDRPQYEQILHDVVESVAPALGWQRS